MIDKIAYLWPEIAMFVGTCVVMVLGLSHNFAIRKSCAPATLLTLLVAGWLGYRSPISDGALPHLLAYAKPLIAGIGVLLVLLLAGTVDREAEAKIRDGKATFDPLRSNRGEFYAFFLFSLTGLMLCATADDLIWLFLALELTSLPTYVMVTISTRRSRSHEAGVKYFFLGALGAAIFLYGFALLYGGTGTTKLAGITEAFASGQINPIAMAGMMLALIGISFKIAAVPMHFYTPDVYEGAAAPVSAFLAFVPKTAGFLAIILLVSTMGWRYGPGGGSLPEEIRVLLWVVAALTMTIGNMLALHQTSIKRILAYSSIAHSGYMLVGVIAGPGDGTFANSGLAAVLFYLLTYGVMTLGAFAVVASVEKRQTADGASGDEIETVADLRGLCTTMPVAGWVMVICSMGLLGLPPLLGFFGKVPLFTSAISAGEIPLVVVLGLNSAIAAWYYLRLAGAAFLEKPADEAYTYRPTPFMTRRLAGLLSAGGVVVLSIVGARFMAAAELGARTEAQDEPQAIAAGE